MSQPTQALEHASVRQYCKAVKVPVIGANFVRLAEQVTRPTFCTRASERVYSTISVCTGVANGGS